jgi:uncharacterized membrane protein YhaH (DUF805 family)
MEWYFEAFRRFAEFDGRSRRKEYWMFNVVNWCLSFAVVMLSGLAGVGTRAGSLAGMGLLGIFLLVTIIPGLAVTVRRLHDTNRSGWWMLISMVPLIGAIALLIFLLQDSDPGPNEYGPNPKALAI